MNEPTDASLVSDALTGDAEAFCTLVRRYQDHAYGVALGVLADFDGALDAAQEAFLCAFCDLTKLKDPDRFGAWVCGIARNSAYEIRRDRQRQKSLAQRVAERRDVTEVAASVDAVAAKSEEHRRVRSALLRIHDKDREAMTLYYADGLSYAEISGTLSVSVGTLKGRLQRGRAAVRKELIMIEQACKDHAPDDGFARRLAQAVGVFGAKGPATSHYPSAWHESLSDETRRILDSGDLGFRIDMAMSHAGSALQRGRTVTRFGLRRDDRSLRELARMLDDRSARVRRDAVRWYAARIHPDTSVTGPHAIGTPSVTASAEVEKLIDRMGDENFNVRMVAGMAISAYRDAGDARVDQALRAALDDPKHKVRHAAARILGVRCRGCGREW